MHVYITPKPLDFNYKMKYVGTVAYIRHCAAHDIRWSRVAIAGTSSIIPSDE